MKKPLEPFGLPSTCNVCDAIGPVHPVTGYCEECQKDPPEEPGSLKDRSPYFPNGLRSF